MGEKEDRKRKRGRGGLRKENEQITLREERARRTLGGWRKENTLPEVKIWIRSGTSE